MLRALSSRQAWLVVAGFVLAALGLLAATPRSAPAAPLVAYNDTALYRDIAAHVAAGDGYYAAALQLQRTHRFPTRPFFTVRPPTLAYIAAALGWDGARWLLGGIAALACLAWLAALDTAPVFERAGALLALIAGSLSLVSLPLVTAHEVWAGVLIALAAALRGGRWWWLGLIAAAAACAIRELAIAYAALALLASLAERRRGEAAAWAGLCALFVLAMAGHAWLVAAQTLPGDPVSQGWSGLRGPAAGFQDAARTSVLALLDERAGMIAALAALLGWTAAPLRQRGLVLAFLSAVLAAMALFARTQNFYWVLMALPLWFVGWAFVPRALRDLGRAAVGRQAGTPP